MLGNSGEEKEDGEADVFIAGFNYENICTTKASQSAIFIGTIISLVDNEN